MFTSDSSYVSPTDKVVALGTGGLAMPTQSNAHDTDDKDIFWTPPTIMKRWLDISEY